MKTTVTKWAAKAAGAGAIALLLAAPSFAQSRGDGSRNSDRGRQTIDAHSSDNRSNGYRENQRVTISGKVSSFTREREGYRVHLDRGQSYWVSQSSFGNRYRDLRPGISISLGGIIRGGAIYFDAVSWPGAVAGHAYGIGYVRGVVDRIDYRNGTLIVRDLASGRLITATTAGGRFTIAMSVAVIVSSSPDSGFATAYSMSPASSAFEISTPQQQEARGLAPRAFRFLRGLRVSA